MMENKGTLVCNIILCVIFSIFTAFIGYFAITGIYLLLSNAEADPGKGLGQAIILIVVMIYGGIGWVVMTIAEIVAAAVAKKQGCKKYNLCALIPYLINTLILVSYFATLLINNFISVGA